MRDTAYDRVSWLVFGLLGLLVGGGCALLLAVLTGGIV